MNLTALKSWVSGETLTAADLNAEFQNIYTHTINNSDIDSTASYVLGELVIGTGLAAADGGQLHVHTGSAGTVQAASDADEAVFENSTASGITILSGGSSTGKIAFGDSGDNDVGLITYNHATNAFTLGTNGTTALTLSSAQAATFAGDVSVGGALTLTGGLTLNGAVVVGDSASDTLTVNATVTSNLIFTDATYDIGASGATRPRDLFLSRNAVIGGTLGVTGLITATGGVSGSVTSSNATITGGTITGITDIAVADGGTGASTASAARTNLGVAIGSDVQAYDAGLADIAALATTDGNIIVGSGSNWVAESGATARTSLGLGSIATQDANAVSITGGSLTGMTSYSGGTISGTTGTFSGAVTVNDTIRLDTGDTTVSDGDVFGDVEFYDNDGGSASAGVTARIQAVASGSFGASKLVFSTSNSGGGARTALTDHVVIDGAGNFSIGTDTPTTFAGYTTLHHKNSSGDVVQLAENDNGVIHQIIASGTDTVLIGSRSNHDLKIGTNDTTAVTIDTSQRVGINTTSPHGPLTVKPATNENLSVFGGSGDLRLSALNDAQSTTVQLSIQADPLYIRGTGGAIKTTFLGNGNVGISTASPKGLIDIAAAGRNAAGDISDVDDYALVIRCSSTTNEGNGIAFTNDDAAVVGGAIIHQDKGSANTGDLVFYTRDTGGNVDEAMRIDNSQRVGIGRAPTSAKLDVEQSANLPSVDMYNSNASFSSQHVRIPIDRAATSAYDFMRMYSGAGFSDTEFMFRGDGNAYADGAWNGSGADYQEYFESKSGSAAEVGRAIVLDGDKVRCYNADTDSTDDIMGVTRPQEDNKNSAVVGNTAWNHWTDKYLTDDWGVYLREDVIVWTYTDEEGNEFAVYERDELAKDPNWTPPEGATSSTQSVRKINPDYDESLDNTYQSREARDEWWLVGLLGQIQVKAGEPVNPRWIKMKNISDAVELYYVR